MSVKPTERELAILQVLWAKGPSSVRTVYESLDPDSQKGYTTTLKLMQLMLDKELLTRDDSQRSHVYAAAVGEKEIQRSLLSRFVDKTFRGSTARLVMQALGQHDASPEELDEIRQLLDKMDAQRKKG